MTETLPKSIQHRARQLLFFAAALMVAAVSTIVLWFHDCFDLLIYVDIPLHLFGQKA